MWILQFSVFTLVVCIQGQTPNYCASTLCKGKQHIACDNDGSFSPTCQPGRTIVNIGPYVDLILDKHNTYRNQIAGGDLQGFSPASRMGTMLWDNELAKLAVLNVKQCAMKHDKCRNTGRYKYAGQNLAWRSGRPPPTAEMAISYGIDKWYNEYKDASQMYIDKYQKAPAVIGHFTAMVNERSIRVGCGLMSQPRDRGTEFFFACNYSQTNVLNRPIYVSGPPASKCTKGSNKKYSNLCDPSEPIDPNKLP